MGAGEQGQQPHVGTWSYAPRGRGTECHDMKGEGSRAQQCGHQADLAGQTVKSTIHVPSPETKTNSKCLTAHHHRRTGRREEITCRKGFKSLKTSGVAVSGTGLQSLPGTPREHPPGTSSPREDLALPSAGVGEAKRQTQERGGLTLEYCVAGPPSWACSTPRKAPCVGPT